MSRMTSTVSFADGRPGALVAGRRGTRTARGLSGDLAVAPVFPTTPAGREAWFNALPSSEQTKFINRIQALFRSMPMPLQQAMTRAMLKSGEKVPFASGVDGYGPVCGLGQWAELASAFTSLAQVGGSLYNTHASNSLAQELQGNALASNAAIEAARQQAAQQAAQIIADAQKATAAQAAAAAQSQYQTQVTQSQIASSTTTSSVKLIAIAGASVAALGLVAYIILKKK